MIRRLTPADWLAFRDIRLEMLRDEPGAFASPYEDWADRPEAMIRDWLTQLQTYGVMHGDTVAACAALSRGRQASTEHRAELVAVYTRPKYRGRGWMRELLNRIEAEARASGIVQLELQVAAWNTPAIATYQGAGFERCGIIPNAICHDGTYSDDIFMVKQLGQT